MGLSGDVSRRHFLVTAPTGADLETALEAFARRDFLIVANCAPADCPDLLETLSAQRPRIVFSLTTTPQTVADLSALAHRLPQLQAQYPSLNLLRLDANASELAARLLDSGAPHPFASEESSGGLLSAIDAERAALAPFKALKAAMGPGYYAIDVGTHTPQEIDQKIAKILGLPADDLPMTVYIQSFGFKRGLPPDAELVFDMRFIPNPYYNPALRPQSGLDAPVCDFIWEQAGVWSFWESWSALIAQMLPQYQRQGKLRLSIAIGCTGGQHRSVCMTEALARFLRETFQEYNVVTSHRDRAYWAKKSDVAAAESVRAGHQREKDPAARETASA